MYISFVVGMFLVVGDRLDLLNVDPLELIVRLSSQTVVGFFLVFFNLSVQITLTVYTYSIYHQ